VDLTLPRVTRPSSLVCFQRLYDFVQLLERLRVFGAHRLLTLAAWIGPLQRTEHGPRHWDRSASVVLFADKIELRLRLRVTGEAVHAEAVVDLGATPRKKLP